MRIAAELIAGFSFEQPFHLWLQEVFRQHKQFGSKDRKFYRDVFYGYWKLGKTISQLTAEQRLLLGLIRLQPENEQLVELLPDMFPGHKTTSIPVDFKHLLGEDWNPYKPYSALLSDKINLADINLWFGGKAPVWVKINPRNLEEMITYLKRNAVKYDEYGPLVIKCGNVNLDEAILKGWCRIQDLSSQESITESILSGSDLIWDTCCGAGGKSMLASEANPYATLYISDTRSQMLHNALMRFSAEGKPRPFSGTANLSRPIQKLIFDDSKVISKPVFDTLICDVPCSGSGTWRRTPEMLHAFSESELKLYAEKQRNIVTNAVKFLKQGGKLIYLTCSVFSAENEENTKYFQEETGLMLDSESYCGGSEKDADYIYRAVFRK